MRPTYVNCLFIALLAAITISPVFMVNIPAMQDYPNHLARMHLLVSARTHGANEFYSVHWSLFPNLAMDLVIPHLARFMNVDAATKFFLVISQALLITGAVSLELSVKKRMELAGPAALLFLYGAPLALGFLNFEFALGLVLWAFSAWIIFEHRAWYTRISIHLIFTFCIYISHIFALGVYGLIISLYELRRLFNLQTNMRTVVISFVLVVTPFIVVLFAVLRFSGVAEPKYLMGEADWFFTNKILSVLLIMNAYNKFFGILSTILGFAIYVLWKERLLSVRESAKWIGGALLALFLLCPSRIGNGSFIDARFLMFAAFIFPAFTSLTISERQKKFVASLIALVIISNAIYISLTWTRLNTTYSKLISSFHYIKPNALILVASNRELALNELPITHAPTLAVYFRRALVSTLFAFPGQQPITLRPRFSDFQAPNTFQMLVPMQILKQIANGYFTSRTPAFVRDWQDRYDYLYILGPHGTNPMPHFIEELDSGSLFTLYRIRKHHYPAERE